MYQCPDCRKPIGLMVNGKNKPDQFLCPHSRKVQPAQIPIRRTTPPRRTDPELDKVVKKAKDRERQSN